jgi:hypothetical protein
VDKAPLAILAMSHRTASPAFLRSHSAWASPALSGTSRRLYALLGAAMTPL